MTDIQVTLRRLSWLGPVTVVAAVLAVVAIQLIILAVLGALPRFSASVLHSTEPAVVTAVFVTVGVLVFGVVGHMAVDPVRTYRRIALVALLLSFLPNLAIAASGMAGADWSSMIALMVMHVAAWIMTVTLLIRFGVRRLRDAERGMV